MMGVTIDGVWGKESQAKYEQMTGSKGWMGALRTANVWDFKRENGLVENSGVGRKAQAVWDVFTTRENDISGEDDNITIKAKADNRPYAGYIEEYESDEYWANQTFDEFLKFPKEQYLARKYPVAGALAFADAKIADKAIKNKYGALDDSTRSNAVRHAFWNALMTLSIGVEKAKMFADAHEVMPAFRYDDTIDNIKIRDNCDMDLFFNQIGRDVGSAILARKKVDKNYNPNIPDILELIEKAVSKHEDRILVR